MADDGEIDIEGEFDFKLEVGDGFYDVNELPSKSANLLPEYTNPPWMLEQGWTLDMDEKSKATIEKMLLEEQQYLNSKTRSKQPNIVEKARKSSSPIKPPSNKSQSPSQSNKSSKINRNKRGWTIEEKSMFIKGLDIFGRSWTKISELIPSRTSLQVKNYAQQYFKNLTKHKDLFTSDTTNNSLEELSSVLASVETGQPTAMSFKSPTRSRKNNCSKSSGSTSTPNRITPIISQTFTSLTSKTSLKSENISVNVLSSNLSPECNSFDNPKSSMPKVFGTNHTFLDSLNSNIMFKTEIPNNLLSSMLIDNTFASTAEFKTENADASNMFEPQSIHICSKLESDHISSDNGAKREDTVSDDEDVDIDIDIENDDEDNSLLLNRSTSPTSVYEKLLLAAKVDLSELHNSEEEIDECEDREDQYSVSSGSSKTFKSDATDGNLKLDEVSNCSSDLQSLSESGTENSHETKIKVQKTLVNGVVSSSGELVEFSIPMNNIELNFDEISEEEQTIHSEFFDGRQSKTPDRYLKIRNHIIETWLKCKPTYLRKTSVRKGLKNCGDVNCIGRIHSYLECTGVINFGCEQAVYNNLNRTQMVTVKASEMPVMYSLDKADAVRCRKRRIRDSAGDWVDINDFEGKTIEHKPACKEDIKPKISRTSKASYDPFKLLPCQHFTQDKKAPFDVELSNFALIMMDVHAHISKTEVIGMLGGRYLSDCGKLEINMAVPCTSMSTGMQCEMDPVSQTQASEKISSKGLKVVGWYHSHPTFSPNPSIRDIETQIKFQDWFSKLGGCHFVGIIISPYNRLNNGNLSEVQCLTISQEICPQLNCNIPYQFDYKVVYSIWNDSILHELQDLAEQYSNYHNTVLLPALYKQATGISCLQKMLESIKQYIEDIVMQDEILNIISLLFQQKDHMATVSCIDLEVVNIETDTKIFDSVSDTMLLQDVMSVSL